MRRNLLRGAKVVAALLGVAILGLLLYRAADAALIVLNLPSRTFRAALENPVVLVRVQDGVPEMVGANVARTLRLDEMPSAMPILLTSTEDRRFLSHNGIDVEGIGRALTANLMALRFEEGGSTLTQQLAKVSFTGDYGDLRRKFVEAAFALRIEAAYSKDEILALYLSRIEFGRVAGVPVYGLREAARVYFGRSPGSLTTAQCAILVAMLNGPSLYDPFRNPDKVADRAVRVVAVAAYAIEDAPSDAEIRAALPQAPAQRPFRDRFLEDRVLGELGVADLPDGWYRAVTSVDPIAEWQARRVVRDEISESAAALNIAQAALVTLDAEGRVLALLGGLDYDRSSFNVVTQGLRQPGSTAKIATYLAALEAGWGLDDPVLDDPDALRGFVPRNVDGIYRGEIPLRQCLRESRNVCTIWLAEQIGMDRVAEMARRLGLARIGDTGNSIVLGAVEASPLAVAAAFAAIANGGELRQPRLLLAVLAHHGVLAFDEAPPDLGRIAADDVIAEMRQLLGEVTRAPGATGRNANYPGGEVFGKTGTTDDNRDAWFVGFTGDGITTAVWLAGPEGEAMAHVSGGGLPALIFARYNRNLQERFQAFARGEPLPR